MGRPKLSARVKYDRECAAIDAVHAKGKLTAERVEKAMQTVFESEVDGISLATFNAGAHCLRAFPETIVQLFGDRLMDFLNESATLPGIHGAIYRKEFLALLADRQRADFVLANIRRGALPDADFAQQLVPLVGQRTFGKWLLTLLEELPEERQLAPGDDFIGRFLSFGAEAPPVSRTHNGSLEEIKQRSGWWSQMRCDDVETGVLLCLEKDPHSLFAHGQSWSCDALLAALGPERFEKVVKLATSSIESLSQVHFLTLVTYLSPPALYKLLERLKEQMTVELFWQAMLSIVRMDLVVVKKFTTSHESVLRNCQPWELSWAAMVDLPAFKHTRATIRNAKQIMRQGMMERGFVFAEVEEVITADGEEMALINYDGERVAVLCVCLSKGDVVVFDSMQDRERLLASVAGLQDVAVYKAECFEYAPKPRKQSAKPARR